MKFSVATSFEKGFVDKVKKYPVYEIFGALSLSNLNTVLSAPFLPFVDKELLQKTIDDAHKVGIKFNYILNNTCTGNIEHTNHGIRNIKNFLKWLSEIQVDIVTVSLPYIIDLIKKNIPTLKVKVSLASFVNTLQRARFYQNKGVDEITLDIDQNRNFKLLRLLKKELRVELTLLVNNCCLWGCPYNFYHYSTNSHTIPTEGYYNNYCDFNCTLTRLKNPVEFIKARWIRPEDLEHYESIGINNFKIGGRTKSTNYLLKTLDAYSNRNYNGNFLEILNTQEQKKANESDSFLLKKVIDNQHKIIEKFPDRLLKLLLQIYRILPKMPATNVADLLTKIPASHIKASIDVFLDNVLPYIDNKKLDGFLEFFENNDCSVSDCDKCGHCNVYMNKAIDLPKDNYKNSIEKIERILHMMNRF